MTSALTNLSTMNFENFFKPTNYAMRVNLSHPDVARNKQWICKIFLMQGPLFLIFCLLVNSIVSHDLKNGDFTQACSNGIACVVFSVVTFKYLALLWYKDIFKSMIAKMNKDYKDAMNFSNDEMIIVQNFVQRGQFVVKTWVVIAIAAAFLFPVKSIILMIYYTIAHEFKYVHFYELTYPDSVEMRKNELATFLMLFLLFQYFALYAMSMYIGITPLGPIFMLHACGQLEVANTRIMKVFRDSKDSKNIMREFKDIGKMIDEIYIFVANAKVGLKFLYEYTLKATIIMLPITLYELTESLKNGDFTIEFVSILIGTITISSTPCYYSDVLMATGERLRLAVYTCGWEKNWNKKCRTFVLLLLMRTSQSLALKTMFGDLCLDALSDVYRQAYTLFNLLNAVWK